MLLQTWCDGQVCPRRSTMTVDVDIIYFGSNSCLTDYICLSVLNLETCSSAPKMTMHLVYHFQNFVHIPDVEFHILLNCQINSVKVKVAWVTNKTCKWPTNRKNVFMYPLVHLF